MEAIQITEDMRRDGVKVGDILDGKVVIWKNYRLIEEFPNYAVNKSCNVREIFTKKYLRVVRVSQRGGLMLNLRKDGKTYTRAAQALMEKAFPEMAGERTDVLKTATGMLDQLNKETKFDGN